MARKPSIRDGCARRLRAGIKSLDSEERLELKPQPLQFSGDLRHRGGPSAREYSRTGAKLFWDQGSHVRELKLKVRQGIREADGPWRPVGSRRYRGPARSPRCLA
ncbi:hypothetical protein MCP1_320014 [Candidatus Terasakiella magnetica]|nr:hypothetical protein MCP1_320014 [Candidatus Terasakiella magnetica]